MYTTINFLLQFDDLPSTFRKISELLIMQYPYQPNEINSASGISRSSSSASTNNAQSYMLEDSLSLTPYLDCRKRSSLVVPSSNKSLDMVN